ncbi:MAG: alcohol dehydrogenase catalytic domain-containing protein [Planctomycetes bacterium]|nr:alcohol dehydrogenase catalytic domain-containing protein [Planctomycetota bacterium]
MRALTFDGSQPALEARRPEPRPAPGEALIRTLRAGVSRTDVAICHGLLGFEGILGHEFVGRVEAIGGEDAAGLAGKRVVGSIGVFCRRCEMCQAGLSQHCRERTLMGMHGRDGCFADLFTLPAANLVAVPDTVDDDHAVFAEPLAAALQAARQLTIEGRPYITVLGDGPLGLLMVQVMVKLNATVRLVGRIPGKLAICEKWGIKHRHVDEVGRRADQDIVVDCTGAANGLELAMSMVRPRGKIVLKTLLAPECNGTVGAPRIDLTPIILNEINVLGSHRGPLNEAVSVLARNEIDVVSLISRRVGLDELPSMLESGLPEELVKVLVSF